MTNEFVGASKGRQVSENPGRERDLADQEGKREAERNSNQRRQGEFE